MSGLIRRYSPGFLIVVCFHFLLLTAPLLFTWVNEELFEFNKMLLTYGVTLVIAGLWSAQMILDRRVIFRRTPFDFFALLLIISQLLSTLFSIHPRTSIFGYYTRFHGGLLSTFAYLILTYAAVNFLNNKHLKQLLLTLFVSTSLVSFYAVGEHFGHSTSCLLINSHFTVQAEGIPGLWQSLNTNLAQTWGVDCWIQDVQHRVFATFGQPNWLAAFLVTVFPLSVSWLLQTALFPTTQTKKTRQWPSWLLPGGLTILITVTLLFTKSRSGFLGWLVAGGTLGLGTLITWWQSQPKTWARKLPFAAGWLGFGLIAAVVWFGTPFSPAIGQQLWPTQAAPSTIAKLAATPPVNRLEEGGSDSGEIRKVVWKGALDVWKRYPLLGSGLETFAYSYYLDRPVEHNSLSEWDFLYNKAHNEFLNFLATTGLVGLAAYLGWLGVIFWLAGKGLLAADVPAQNKLMISGWVGGVAGLSITNFFGFSTVVVSILLFLSPAALFIESKNIDKSKKRTISESKKSSSKKTKLKPKPTSDQQGSLLVVAMITFFGLFTIWGQWRADHLFYMGQEFQDQGDYISAAEYFETAINISNQEAVYYQHAATTYANLAVELVIAQEPETATIAARRAEDLMTEALRLNPAHLNIYKAQARMYIILAQIDLTFLEKADQAMQAALERSPTDAKLRYNRALLAIDQERPTDAQALLEEAIGLKPNYTAARLKLAELLLDQENPDPEAAVAQYDYILTKINPYDTPTRDKMASVSAEFNLEIELPPVPSQ